MNTKYHPWMAHDGGDLFSADASDFKEAAASTATPINCPICGEHGGLFGQPVNRPLAAKYPMLFAERDAEGNVTSWVGHCGCGQRLVVFND